jgi:hypothetical protein
MVPARFFSQLVRIALGWLCLLLHWMWSSDPAPRPPTPAPIPPVPKHQRERTPFAGLTTKPHGDACAHATAPRPQAPAAPPPRIVMTRGRRRQVDTARHCCPNPACASRGGGGWGNLRAKGHPHGGPWRQLLCVACRGSCLETLGTLFHGKRGSAELIVRVIACLAEGLGIRGTARVFEVEAHTVLQWLVEAAEQLRAFSQHVLHDVRVRQVQLDELFALLSTGKEGTVSEAEASARLERAPQGVWAAMAPERTLLLALDVGDRTLAMAQRMVHHVAQVLAPACAPLLLTDGFREYLTALLTHDGQWVQPPRRQATGPAPKPRWLPLPGRLYAQGGKTVRRRRLVAVQHRVVCGTIEAVNQVLSPLGWQSNTAFVERLHRSLRHHGAAIGRRVSTRCKGDEGLRQQVALYHTYDTFCWPHSSLRLPLAQPEATKGTGSARQWHLQTPAMAAGLTDHVWTLREG